jgi:hypothetical protein
MDSASGSHSAFSVQWKLLGKKIPRAQIVYFAQLFLCLTLIITSVVMSALKDPNCDFLDGHFEFLGGLRHAWSSDGEYKTTDTLNRLVCSPLVNQNTLGNNGTMKRG